MGKDESNAIDSDTENISFDNTSLSDMSSDGEESDSGGLCLLNDHFSNNMFEGPAYTITEHVYSDSERSFSDPFSMGNVALSRNASLNEEEFRINNFTDEPVVIKPKIIISGLGKDVEACEHPFMYDGKIADKLCYICEENVADITYNCRCTGDAALCYCVTCEKRAICKLLNHRCPVCNTETSSSTYVRKNCIECLRSKTGLLKQLFT